MKIIQITPIIENHSFPNMDEVYPNEDATIFGLGDDGKPYVWALVKNERINLPKPDEDGNTYKYLREYGWVSL